MKKLLLAAVFAALTLSCFAETPDCSRLTSKNHPRLFFTEKGFKDLTKQLGKGTNPYLTGLHECMMDKAMKDGLNKNEVTFDAEKQKATFNGTARKLSYRIISGAYGYRLTRDRKYLDCVISNIDIFADNFRRWTTNYWLENSELCLSFALAYDWLYKDLPAATKEKIVKAIEDVGYNDAADEKKAWFYRSGNNWNHVCNATLICAAIATYEAHPEASAAIIEKSIASNPSGMKGVYAPDGASPESPSYWDYATNYEAIMLMALEDNFGTEFGLSKSEGFEKGGRYRAFCVSSTGRWFNYGDCNAGSAESCIALWYYAWKFGRKDLLFRDVQNLDAGYAKSSRALFMAIACAQRMGHFETTYPVEHLFTARGTVHLIIARSGWGKDDAYLGLKGGKGKCNHSHLDEGSFVYEVDGLRWATDLNHPSYELYRRASKALKKEGKKFAWYEKFGYCNQNHNTLTINGKYMNDDGFASIVDSFDTDERRGGTLDLSEMFKGEVASAVRTAAIIKGHDLEVKDVIKALPGKPAHIRWSLVSEAKARITPEGIILSQEGKEMLVKANAAVTYKTWSINPKDYDDSPVRAFDPKPSDIQSISGFEFDLPAGKQIELVTRFSSR